MFSMVLVGSGSVSFYMDPDSGSSHFLIRILIQGNDTDSTGPDPQHWVPVYFNKRATSYSGPCVGYILLSFATKVFEIVTG